MSASVRLVFGDAREWRYIVASLAALVDEANFTIDPSGMRLRALDPSRIAMVDFNLPASAFEEFSCEEEVKIGVNFDELNKVMKRGRADERVILEVVGGRLRISIGGKAERSFSLPVIDIAGEELPLPKLNFTVRAKMLSDTLKDAIKDAELVSDSVSFDAKEDYLRVYAHSDKGEVEVKFTIDTGSLIEYEVDEPSRSTYPISYLSDMLKRAANLSDIAGIEFATDKPLLLSFELAGGGRLSYFLAPRLEA
ncbi:MAG: proliferating cell nuclear antigen (pcna) [Thermoprotei archaeon]|nr:MAG: proliferating cell nuclear antigen (pcna) [Thermoprotei archaeon]